MENEKIQFDFISLCETFLSDKNHDLFNIYGYIFISRHRKCYRHGGVGIYIKNNINFIVRDDLSIFLEKSFETLFLEVSSSKGKPIIIGEVYRVPSSSYPDSLTNYEFITDKLQKENKEIIIGTDQKFDYLNMNCAYSKHLLEIIFLAGLVPTLIDNIYIRGNRLDTLQSGISVADISDHFPIVVFIGKNVRSCKPKKKAPIMNIENMTLQLLIELTPFC